MNNSTYLKVQEFYNKRRMSGIEGLENPPFWQLSDREQEYYKWLMERDEKEVTHG